MERTALTIIVGEAEVTELPPIVAEIVLAVPAPVPVKVELYVPFPLSVVGPIVAVAVPPELEKTTVSPPEVMLFPLESLAVSVKVEVPPTTIVAALTVIVLCTNEAAPAVPVAEKVTEVAVPLIVAVTVLAPAVVPRVSVDELKPEALVALEDDDKLPPPEATVQSTVTPETTLLLESLTTAMNAEVNAEPAVPL